MTVNGAQVKKTPVILTSGQPALCVCKKSVMFANSNQSPNE